MSALRGGTGGGLTRTRAVAASATASAVAVAVPRGRSSSKSSLGSRSSTSSRLGCRLQEAGSRWRMSCRQQCPEREWRHVICCAMGCCLIYVSSGQAATLQNACCIAATTERRAALRETVRISSSACEPLMASQPAQRELDDAVAAADVPAPDGVLRHGDGGPLLRLLPDLQRHEHHPRHIVLRQRRRLHSMPEMVRFAVHR
jgi:hypothetical protein